MKSKFHKASLSILKGEMNTEIEKASELQKKMEDLKAEMETETDKKKKIELSEKASAMVRSADHQMGKIQGMLEVNSLMSDKMSGRWC